MTAVIFNAANFKTRYPEFNGVPDAQLQACFDEATLYLSNSDTSPVQDISRRTVLLNMLTAHVAYIGGKLGNNGGQPLPVGRTSNATEGSVSVGLEYAPPGTQAWYVQTQYGAAFWQATLNLRRFRYRPRPTLY